MTITKLDKAQIIKVVKAAVYVALSAGLSYLITYTTDNPDLFGVFTVLINTGLVFLKQLVTPVE